MVNISQTGLLPGSFSGGPAVYKIGGHFVGDKFVHDYNPFPRPENDQPSVEHPPSSNVPPQNPPSPGEADIETAAEVTLDAAGAAAGAGENILSGGGDYWLSNRGYYKPEFRGNQYVTGYRAVTRGIRVLRGAGLGLYGVQMVMAGANLYHDPSAKNFWHQGRNLAVGGLAFTGLPGFVTATIYFSIEDTIGWDEFISGYTPSPILSVPDYF